MKSSSHTKFVLAVTLIVMASLSGAGVPIRAAGAEPIPTPSHNRAAGSQDSSSKVPEPRIILDRLKAADAALSKGFTATGTCGHDSQWTVSLYEDYCIIVEKLCSSPPTAKDIIEHNKRPALGGRGGRGQTVDVKDRPLRAFIVEDRISYFGPHCSARKDLVLSYKLTSEEKVEKSGEHASIHFEKPGAPTYSLPYRKIVWSLGRGFSKYIEDITSVTELPNGNYHCKATARDYDSESRRWELEIDPRQNFLAISATYFRHSKPYYQVDVKETAQVGDMFFAKKTHWRGPLRAQAQWECESVHFQTDPELRKTVHRELFGPYSTSADVHDETGSKRIYRLKKIGETYRLAYISLTGRALPYICGLCPSLTPEQIKGKYVLVCFWDGQQRSSRRALKQLDQQREELQDKDICVVSIHTREIDSKTVGNWLAENKISIPVGELTDNGENVIYSWGVRGLPWLILTDREHTVRAEGFGVAELEEKLAAIKVK